MDSVSHPRVSRRGDGNSGGPETMKLNVITSTKRIFACAYRTCLQPIGDLSESVKRLKLFLQTNRTVAPTFRLTWASWRQASKGPTAIAKSGTIHKHELCGRCLHSRLTSSAIVCIGLSLPSRSTCALNGVNKVAADAKFAKCPSNLYTHSINVFGKSIGDPYTDR